MKDWNKTALIFDGAEISYSRLISNTVRFSKSYRMKKGGRAVIFSENRPEWVYAFYSVWMNGGINVPMDASLPAEDAAAMLKDCRPSIIFCSAGTRSAVSSAVRASRLKIKIIVFEKFFPDRSDDVPDGDIIRIGDADDTAVIIYTSGTTGKAKGVMLTFDNIITNMKSITDPGMITRDDRMIALLPFHHIFPLQGSVIVPLYVGATVVFVKSLSSEEILSTLQKHRVTMFLGVPRLYELFHNAIMGKIKKSLFARLLLSLARRVNSIRFSRMIFGRVHRAFGGSVHSYLTGGARMDMAVAADLWALGFRLVEGYGLAETAPLIAFNPYDGIKLGSVGKPMKWTEVKIEKGEILVRGRNIMKGYYKMPGETARVMRGGWFHTGDLGEFDRDGYLYVTGRKDEMIVLPSGKNINPEEIEKNIMNMSPLVKDIGVMQENGRLTALIYPDFYLLKKENIINILEAVKSRVIDRYNSMAAGYKRIIRIALIKQELPKTRLGKPRRFMFREMMDGSARESGTKKDPDFREYAMLRDYLRGLTGSAVNPGDRLDLDLGLDSLAKVEMHAFVEMKFGISLSDGMLWENSTVEEMANFIRDMKTRIEEKDVDWNMIINERMNFDLPFEKTLPLFVKSIFNPLLRWYFKISVSGLDNLPDGPFIFTPNHQSYLDAPFLMSVIPDGVLRETWYIVKESKTMNRVVRLFSLGRNMIFINIDRELKTTLQMAADVLRHGKKLMIFPEGIRSYDGKISAFKRAFAILGVELEVPVVPVAIDGSYEAFPRGSSFPRRGNISITFGRPLFPGSCGYDTLVKKVENSVKKMLKKK